MASETVLTPEQVADRLQVKRRTIIAWLQTGEIQGIKIGRLWRVRESEIDQFLNAHQAKKSSNGKPIPLDRLAEIDEESRRWMDADLGGSLPPYDWGAEGEPKGKPIQYMPGIGLVVVEDSE